MKEKIKKYLSADIPVLLWEPPGTGKTACVEAMAMAMALANR